MVKGNIFLAHAMKAKWEWKYISFSLKLGVIKPTDQLHVPPSSSRGNALNTHYIGWRTSSRMLLDALDKETSYLD
jgi:hypothetical protein